MKLRRQRLEGWFKPRQYSHFDHPLTFERAKAIASDRSLVERHSFLPLLSYTETKRQFRTDNSNRSIPVRQRPRLFKNKERDIKYAAHRDAAIYAFYAKLAQERYEALLRQEGLSDAVIGYRSGLGSNVDMAAAAFAEVSERGEVTALCFDVSNFFPSVSHATLKKQLCKVLQCSELPLDWYKVFRASTKFSSIELKDVAELFGFDPRNPPTPLVPDIAKAMEVIRASGCMLVNKKSHGIPQGTPISAVLANISMLEFDEAVASWVTAKGGTYRRYSDDILVLVDAKCEPEAIDCITNAAAREAGGLEINPDKTEVSRFVISQGQQVSDRPLTYLGFTFDGDKVTLRSRTLSRYYRRMTYAARGTVRGARKIGKPASQAFRRTIYKELTHLGSANFYSYAKKADSKFHRSAVKRQLRRHFAILLRKLRRGGR